jgi:hypothetical protein
MFLLLLNPWVQRIAIVAALIVCYAFWANHEKSLGAATEQVREEAIAIDNAQKVDAEANAVDQSVAKDNTPQDTLQKQWSQP